jgi:hypothetical protein
MSAFFILSTMVFLPVISAFEHPKQSPAWLTDPAIEYAFFSIHFLQFLSVRPLRPQTTNMNILEMVNGG